jgi:hypothetical protein
MSICCSGLDAPCRVHPVTIDVSPTHPLIQLALVIPWHALAAMVLPDLQHTTATVIQVKIPGFLGKHPPSDPSFQGSENRDYLVASL